MPATPSINSFTVSKTNIAINVTAGVDTTHVQWDRSWVANTGSNDLEMPLATGNSYTQNFTPPSTPGSYTVSVRARSGSTASSWVSRGFVVEPDVPPPDPNPSITSISVDSENAINVSWSVGNSAYVRPSNSFAVYLSGVNSSGQYFQTYLDSSTRSWAKGTDGTGSGLVIGGSYTVWVYAYNKNGESFGNSKTFTFTKTKPSQFNWSTAKISGNACNLTSSEWSGLLDKINEFRGYRGLAQLSFNKTISSGAINTYVTPTASSFNSAINAINTMPNTFPTPPPVYSGDIITADRLNRLRDALNSIT